MGSTTPALEIPEQLLISAAGKAEVRKGTGFVNTADLPSDEERRVLCMEGSA